jgi:hypothetical protein
MADTTYPAGVGEAVTLVTASALTTALTGNEYSVDLGTAAPPASLTNQQSALGVIFDIDYTSGTETAFNVSFQASVDDTNWFDMDEYDLVPPVEDSHFRMHIQPLMPGERFVRIRLLGTVSASGTVTITARLTGVNKIISGGVTV